MGCSSKVNTNSSEAISGAWWHWSGWQQSPSYITATAKVSANERCVIMACSLSTTLEVALGALANEGQTFAKKHYFNFKILY